MRIALVSFGFLLSITACRGSGKPAGAPGSTGGGEAMAGKKIPLPCEQVSEEAFFTELARLGQDQPVPELWEAELGSCHVKSEKGYVDVTEGGQMVFSAKEAGASRAWHPAFSVEGVRVGMDAAVAARLLAARGYTELECAGSVDTWGCEFDKPVRGPGCDNHDVHFTLARDPEKDPPSLDTIEALENRGIVSLVLSTPC